MSDHATIVNPYRYVQAMAAAFQGHGGRVVRDDVRALQSAGPGRWRVASEAGSGATPEAVFDHVVVAAGAWSRALLDPLGIRIPLESQRGYHVQFEAAARPSPAP